MCGKAFRSIEFALFGLSSQVPATDTFQGYPMAIPTLYVAISVGPETIVPKTCLVAS